MDSDGNDKKLSEKEEAVSSSANGNGDKSSKIRGAEASSSSKDDKRSSESSSKDDKRSSESSSKDDKRSSELEKYWQTVRENSSDFTGWTYLLQFVEQEGVVKYAREAFDAFFERYPYCYGYWKKYADLERKNKNLDKCKEVYERGVAAIPLSVDLWIHYLNFATSYHSKEDDYVQTMSRLYERAIETVGLDFRSDKLWDKYIDWETNQKNYQRVTEIYDKLLSTPTQLYSHHYENFQMHISNNHPKDLLSLDDFLKIRKEVLSEKQSKTEANDAEEGTAPGDDLPPGVDEDVPPGMEESSNGTSSKVKDDDEVKLIRRKLIELREVVHKRTEEEVSKRWNYEEGIRRPYFHVKALEKGQIKNWKEYLDFEIAEGDHDRIVLLFERCIIACALYEDFWIKYASYMEEKNQSSVSDIYRRACMIHLPKKTYIHLHWATFEERIGNIEQARAIFSNIEKQCPGLVMLTMRKISFERRQGNLEAVNKYFQSYIDSATDRETCVYYSVKYARYLSKLAGDHEKANLVLMTAIEKYPDNPKLYLQLIDVELCKTEIDEEKVLMVFDMATNSDLPVETKILFSQRKMEFLEDFGTNMEKVMKAYDQHQKFVKDGANDSVKKRKLSEATTTSDGQSTDAKKTKTTEDSVTSTSVSSTYNHGSADPNATYNYGQWANYNNAAAYAAYSYNQWQGPHTYNTTH